MMRRRNGAAVSFIGIATFALVNCGGVVGRSSPTERSPGAGASSDPCSWETLTTPKVDPGVLGDRLHAVSVLSEDDIWAVGDALDSRENGTQKAIAMHWNGSDWQLADLPEVGPTSSLTDVAAVGTNEAWAVGFSDDAEGTGPRPVILHWDGKRWTRVSTPDAGTRYQGLNAVAFLTPDDGWSVGFTATGKSGGTLALHWDGNQWAIVPTPSPPPRPLVGAPYPSLEAVTALSNGDAWAVGQTTNVAPAGPSNTLIEHWDGEEWGVTSSPDIPSAENLPFSHLFGAAATAPDNAWAVGIHGSEPGYFGGGDQALVEHWDGTQWSVADLPPVPGDSRLFDVATSPDAAWAVGSTGVAGSFRPLVLRWDAGKWGIKQMPESLRGWLSDVALDSTGSVWGVGTIEEEGAMRSMVVRCR